MRLRTMLAFWPVDQLDLQQTLCEAERGVGELRDEAALGIDRHEHLLRATVSADLAKGDLPAAEVDDHRSRHPCAEHSLILGPRLRDQLRARRTARGDASREASVTIQQQHVGLEQLAQPLDQPRRRLLCEQCLEQMLLQRHAAPQAVHVARRQSIEHVARDLAEGSEFGDPEERQTFFVGGLEHDRRYLADVGHDGHADAHHAVLLEKAHEPHAALRVALEARPGGEQQATLHHPRRGIVEVADVDRLDDPINAGAPGHDLELQVALLNQLANGERFPD